MTKTTQKLKEIVEAGAAVVMMDDSMKSAQGKKFRRHLAIGTLAAVAATFLGGVSAILFLQARKSRAAHLEWKDQDQKLDRDLEDSLDASDAVAKY